MLCPPSLSLVTPLGPHSPLCLRCQALRSNVKRASTWNVSPVQVNTSLLPRSNPLRPQLLTPFSSLVSHHPSDTHLPQTHPWTHTGTHTLPPLVQAGPAVATREAPAEPHCVWASQLPPAWLEGSQKGRCREAAGPAMSAPPGPFPAQRGLPSLSVPARPQTLSSQVLMPPAPLPRTSAVPR